MKDFFKYLPVAGFLYAIWSVFNLNWLGVGVGLIVFFGGFLVFYRKNKEKFSFLQRHLKAMDDLVIFVLENVYKENLHHPKLMLIRGLFLIGAIDSASQAVGFEDKQFIELANTIFKQAGFSDEFRNKIILFHQRMHSSHDDMAYEVIMMGGQCYVELINGNKDAPVGAADYIKKQIDNSDFPDAI